GRCSSSYSSRGSTSTSCASAAISVCTCLRRSWPASVATEHVAEDDTSCFCGFGDRDRCAVDLRVLAQVARCVLRGFEEVEHVAAAAEAWPVATGGAGEHDCPSRLPGCLLPGVELKREPRRR